MPKHALQVLHDHSKARIVVPFLLRQHKIERQGGGTGVLLLMEPILHIA